MLPGYLAQFFEFIHHLKGIAIHTRDGFLILKLVVKDIINFEVE